MNERTREYLGNAKNELLRAIRLAEANWADIRRIEKLAEQIEALQAKLKATGGTV